MKRFMMISLLLMLLCATVSAQQDRVYFYGVDYSQVKVLGAKESISDFADAFYRINMLMLSEKEKYDFSRVLHTSVVTSVETMLEVVRNGNYSNMMVYDSDYDVEDIDLEAMVRSYSFRQESGTGLVLVARLLNKIEGIAVFDVVMFDVASRQITFTKRVYGEAGGFGLRNYWARPVYSLTQFESLFY